MANYQFKKICAGRDYIAENYLDSFNLVDAARHAHLSPYHFLRVFKSTFGETPNAFLIRLRIEKAKNMLVTENASIMEVCENVGYLSLGSFSSRFREQVGVAPSLYRRKIWSLSTEAFRYPAQAIPSCYAYHFLGVSAK
ncbi:MAG: helix-turn-helix domain-containing protein [Cellvibrionaceae bacterium]